MPETEALGLLVAAALGALASMLALVSAIRNRDGVLMGCAVVAFVVFAGVAMLFFLGPS